MDQPYDKLRDEVVEQIARTGACYTNEAKALAREVKELREALRRPPQYDFGLYP